MYKNGFKFQVTKNGIIGEIDGITTNGIYSVCFYKNNEMYYRADVHEGTIKNNLEYGFYKEIK